MVVVDETACVRGAVNKQSPEETGTCYFTPPLSLWPATDQELNRSSGWYTRRGHKDVLSNRWTEAKGVGCCVDRPAKVS